MSWIAEKTKVAESERARRASEDSAAGGPKSPPDPEVTERPQRRRFTAEYKLRIVREADACKGDGDVGALLRREGLYSSQLSSWRHQREAIAKAGMTASKRGRKATRWWTHVSRSSSARMRAFAVGCSVPTSSSISKKKLPSSWGSP